MTLTTEKAGTYPEFMKTEEFDTFFKDSKQKNFDDLDKAVEFLRKNTDWQIYTEIEADNPEAKDPEDEIEQYMDKGFHICNRTGNYSLVKDSRFQVMQYNLSEKIN